LERSIVDRREELASLMAQVELLADGQRRVVFVTGEAGIGKTALVDALCQQLDSVSAPGLAARLGRGQCVEGFGRKEEYYPVAEALSQLCAAPDGGDACTILARMAPAWLAALGREPAQAAHSASRERMPGDLCAALEELAAEKPLVLVFEDLHWADDSTLHLISALARRRAPAKLLVLATYRAQDVTVEHSLRGLKQDLRLRRLCTEIALTPLPESAVRELVARELKQEALPKGLAGFVHRRSDGNPLFVIAILEHLIAQRYLVRKQNGSEPVWEQRATFAEMEAGVPEGLAQMIELEMERLSEGEQRLLEAGSLISVAFPAWAVAAALELDAAEVEEACDGLARRLHFVDRAGQDELPDGTRTSFYVFAHELYREVLYGRQTEARRARRHIRIARRLAELFAGREGSVGREIAIHYEAAGDWRQAVEALQVAARHALDRHAHAEAAELLERALRIAENLTETERNGAAREIADTFGAVREVLVAGADRQG
jgi:predicted ATPase